MVCVMWCAAAATAAAHSAWFTHCLWHLCLGIAACSIWLLLFRSISITARVFDSLVTILHTLSAVCCLCLACTCVQAAKAFMVAHVSFAFEPWLSNCLLQLRSMLLEGPDIVVADEAHEMRNAATNFCQAMQMVSPFMDYAFMFDNLDGFQACQIDLLSTMCVPLGKQHCCVIASAVLQLPDSSAHKPNSIQHSSRRS